MELLRDTDGEWAKITATYIENTRWFGTSDAALHALENNSDQIGLYRLFMRVAVERAVEQGLTPDDAKASKLLNEASDCATAIIYAFQIPTKDPGLDRARRLFQMTWSAAPGNLVYDTQSFGGLQVSRDDLESGVGQYLRSDFKDARIDRYLVRALADMEISSFLWSQIGPKIPLIKSPLEIMRQSVLMAWLKQTALRFAIAAAVCSGLVALKIYFPATPDWLVLAGIILFAGGFIVLTTVSSIFWLIKGPGVAAARKSAFDTFQAAVDFYAEFHRPGTISLPHYRRRLEEARQRGVVWPQTLWALLDDMDHRQVRAF